MQANDELQRTRDGNAAASPLNSVLGRTSTLVDTRIDAYE